MDVQQAIQAMTAPAVFVSGGGLLLLSLNARLSSVFNRVRGLYDRGGNLETRRLLGALHRRARRLRNAFVFALLGVGSCLASSLLMALGTFLQPAAVCGFATLIGGVVALIGSVGFYLAEVVLALPSLDLGHVSGRTTGDDPESDSHPSRRDAA